MNTISIEAAGAASTAAAPSPVAAAEYLESDRSHDLEVGSSVRTAAATCHCDTPRSSVLSTVLNVLPLHDATDVATLTAFIEGWLKSGADASDAKAARAGVWHPSRFAASTAASKSSSSRLVAAAVAAPPSPQATITEADKPRPHAPLTIQQIAASAAADAPDTSVLALALSLASKIHAEHKSSASATATATTPAPAAAAPATAPATRPPSAANTGASHSVASLIAARNAGSALSGGNNLTLHTVAKLAHVKAQRLARARARIRDQQLRRTYVCWLPVPCADALPSPFGTLKALHQLVHASQVSALLCSAASV